MNHKNVKSLFFLFFAFVLVGCKSPNSNILGGSQPSDFTVNPFKLRQADTNSLHSFSIPKKILAIGTRLSDLSFYRLGRDDQSLSMSIFDSQPTLAPPPTNPDFGKLLRKAQKPGARVDALITSLDFSHDGNVLAVGTESGVHLYEFLYDQNGEILDICEESVDNFLPGQPIESVRFTGHDLKAKKLLYRLVSQTKPGILHISVILPRVARNEDGSTIPAKVCSARAGSGNLADDATYIHTVPMLKLLPAIGQTELHAKNWIGLQFNSVGKYINEAFNYPSKMLRVEGPFIETKKSILSPYIAGYSMQYVYLIRFADGTTRYLYEAPNHKALQGWNLVYDKSKPHIKEVYSFSSNKTRMMLSYLGNRVFVSEFSSYGEEYFYDATKVNIGEEKANELYNTIYTSKQKALMRRVKKLGVRFFTPSNSKFWVTSSYPDRTKNLFWLFSPKHNIITVYLTPWHLHPIQEGSKNNRVLFSKDPALRGWIPDTEQVWPIDHERLLSRHPDGTLYCLDFKKASCGPL